MNQDELRGKMDKAKGRIKQAAGDLTDNQRLHDEGVVDETIGKVEDFGGRARRKVGEALDDVADKIKK
jgi:uncharacterized protein YjbJ (UPF0337 family)